MIASLNIVAKTFVGLSMIIIATRRRHVLILHLEEKYTKMDCKNEICAKNWVMSTKSQKVNYGKKSTVNAGQSQQVKSKLVKVNGGRSKMM